MPENCTTRETDLIAGSYDPKNINSNDFGINRSPNLEQGEEEEEVEEKQERK